jgi:hypothetical protein
LYEELSLAESTFDEQDLLSSQLRNLLPLCTVRGIWAAIPAIAGRAVSMSARISAACKDVSCAC